MVALWTLPAVRQLIINHTIRFLHLVKERHNSIHNCAAKSCKSLQVDHLQAFCTAHSFLWSTAALPLPEEKKPRSRQVLHHPAGAEQALGPAQLPFWWCQQGRKACWPNWYLTKGSGLCFLWKSMTIPINTGHILVLQKKKKPKTPPQKHKPKSQKPGLQSHHLQMSFHTTYVKSSVLSHHPPEWGTVWSLNRRVFSHTHILTYINTAQHF